MKLIKLFFLIICSFLIVGCDNKPQEKNLIVATSADNPPYEFIQNGQIVGLDIDIINAIGEKLEKKVIIKNFDFNGLLASLASENVDIVIAGLTVTEERKKHISFSAPYVTTNVSVLYRTADDLKNVGDLDNKIVGVQLGTTWAVIVQDLAKQFNIRTNYLSNNLMLVEELKSKVVDVVVLEESQSKKFIENNPDLASFSLTEFSSELAIAMPKDSKLVENIDKAISELKKDGTISRITKKWLQ
ncbi:MULTISPECIES: ABC transporter substrate-binding protein [Rickettsieae]|uniref:ABC transporter substrate-binding protein n=1 Tax=Rickettsieae TaxID=33988 RepID=UPI000B9B5F56|nr:ABC transporter substrate-binding protein [Rickettsia endosymbiont of Culicoides newsteadi]MDN3030755.1 ABC transporter substrate-binding protein [Candidatus Tisiphia sp.]OZG32498.1 amino acid ABC transporter substrate-binding protein [Rickettsia endosymbiont of Culicoides newsteadi]HJD57594.1 ABC transporter substrate-binding protein [Rickettsia endosymbiont of Sericostoma sp. HW-2014]HJD63984.1 ABC transporter substrate-binding protein [Rickettsia endosymbiont of Sericostoma sp.]